MLVPSFTKNRRSATIGAIVAVGLLLALAAGAITYFGMNGERIRHYDVDVAVQRDGSALVRETIDYDFGNNDRHGIFRFFPGYGFAGGDPEATQVISDVRVRSASAPAKFERSDGYRAEIRVGDPDVEVSGLHRYVLEYRITGVTSGNRLGFDAIGTDWNVPVDAADIRLTAPFQLSDVGCYRGRSGTDTPCERVEHRGATVTAHVEDLDPEQGVTIDGTQAGALTGPPRTTLPGVDLTGGGDGRSYWTTIWLVLAWGGLGYVVGMLLVIWWARRAGRDRAWAGGGIDAVFGDPGMDSAPISDRAAEQQVTMQFEPPRDLSPAQGGVVLFEEVKDNHHVAWLTQQALAGFLTIEKNGKLLRRTVDEEKWANAPAALRRMFYKRDNFRLGKYDSKFATGFKLVDEELKEWRATCELWDHDAERRNRRVARVVKWVGIVAGVVGAIVLFLVAPLPVAYAVAGASALLVGAGVSMSMSEDELSVRTPPGFAARQLVEGFRRFFAASEGRHARAAAERGELRLYSAWAVALGELDRWNTAMAAATLPPGTAGVTDTTSLVYMNSSLHTTATAPTSSGSSGGSSGGSSSSGGGYSGGGDVGGGAGGGGGGSW